MLLPLVSDAHHAADERVSDSNKQQAAMPRSFSKDAYQVLCWTVA